MSMHQFKKSRLNPDQLPLSIVVPETGWTPPVELPDLPARGVRRVALDTENRDDGLAADRGPGWATKSGYVCGVSCAWYEGDQTRSLYAPVRHPETECMDPDVVRRWLEHLMRSGTEVVFMNASYDLGWLGTQYGLSAPATLHDVQAMAVMLDENRMSYSLDDICAWQGVPGKDTTMLLEAGLAYGLGRTLKEIKSKIYRLPARLVGPYAEQDAISTLLAADQMMPQLDAQGVTPAYELEMNLTPMIVAMRRRGIRIDTDAVERAQTLLYAKRDEALSVLSEKIAIGRRVDVRDLNSSSFLESAFDAHGIPYPRTSGDRGSFDKEWMKHVDHWLPQCVVLARSSHDAAHKFLGTYILDHVHLGRVHAEIHQLRDDEGGTRTFRLSYANPPLQQMPARDELISTLVRGCFLPEEGELWLAADYSQQEYRLIVHFAAACKILGAERAVEIYRNDPGADFHKLVADWTGLERKPAKDANFAKSYGAGVAKFAAMTGKSEDEAASIMKQYDREMPFVRGLAEHCQNRAQRRGYLRLIDGARSHFDLWEPAYYRGPFHPACSHGEARHHVHDPAHDWYGCRLRRAFTHKAMNRLIQGSAARQAKAAMLACWRAGLLPLIQMHDELGFSVSRESDGARVGSLMREVVPLLVPMKVDLEYGATWGGARKLKDRDGRVTYGATWPEACRAAQLEHLLESEQVPAQKVRGRAGRPRRSAAR